MKLIACLIVLSLIFAFWSSGFVGLTVSEASKGHTVLEQFPGWIPEEMIMPWRNPMIVKSWIKLEAYVDYESRRHEPDYYENARQLAERCLSWRAKNLPDARITWVGDAL